MTDAERAELEAILGHTFEHPEWLDRALTHRSHRATLADADNERLEFLGDRVLGLVTSEHLCRTFPEWDAGKLSRGLARLVSAHSIHQAAQRLQLGRHLRLGAGEEKTGGREKKRLLADAFEAVIGAIYLDAGLQTAAAFLNRTLFEPALAADFEALEHRDHKSKLQEFLQQRAFPSAEYRVRSQTGPDHQKTFEVELWQDGRMLASGHGRSKKEAEQGAARIALEELAAHDRVVPTEDGSR